MYDKIIRTAIFAVAITVLGVVGGLLLLATSLRSLVYKALNRENYWDVSNEWFQIVQDWEMWLEYWKYGKK